MYVAKSFADAHYVSGFKCAFIQRGGVVGLFVWIF